MLKIFVNENSPEKQKIIQSANENLRGLCPHCLLLSKIDNHGNIFVHNLPIDPSVKDFVEIPECPGTGQNPKYSHVKELAHIIMRKVPENYVWTIGNGGKLERTKPSQLVML